MNTLAIILIIVNFLFFIALTAVFIINTFDLSKTAKRNKEKLDDDYRSFRQITNDLHEILTNHEVIYKERVFNITEVYIVNNGELKVRLSNDLEFNKCVSIKDIQINKQ